MKSQFVKANVEAIQPFVWGGIPEEDLVSGREVLLLTGAKAYYRGGDLWLISGYAFDGKDVDAIVSCLK